MGLHVANQTSFKKGMTPWNKGVDITIQCKECKVLFLAKPYQINKSNPTFNKKYCSKECSNKGHILQREFYQNNYRKGIGRLGHPGSELRKRAAEKMRGERHFAWRKDRTVVLEKHRLRGTADWKNWRRKVFLRDNYTCQECNIKGGILEPHHIIPIRVNMERIFDINNGITLCFPCHKKTLRKEHIFENKYFKKIGV